MNGRSIANNPMVYEKNPRVIAINPRVLTLRRMKPLRNRYKVRKKALFSPSSLTKR